MSFILLCDILKLDLASFTDNVKLKIEFLVFDEEVSVLFHYLGVRDDKVYSFPPLLRKFPNVHFTSLD